MEPVARKTRRTGGKHARIALLILLAAVLALTLALIQLTRQEPQNAVSDAPAADQVLLFAYPPEDVLSVDVRIEDEPRWQVVQDAETGLFVLQGDDGFMLSQTMTSLIQEGARTLTCESILSENPSEYAEHLADFGLDTPSRIASITFRDGRVITVRIGDRAPHTNAWYYMTIDGDDRLYALSTGMVNALSLSRESLREVTQPVIHKTRIDRITLTDASGTPVAQWALQGSIEASDALDRWQITQPYVYPASAQSISALLQNAANLRLGAYVAPATAENLTSYGFDEPRMTIDIHMAEGTIGTTNAEGVFTTEDWPESAVTLVIGGARSDLVDYVLFGDSIYVSSHFTVGVFLNADVRSSMNRYPVLTALGNLSSLLIMQDGQSTEYVITRTERVEPNNELATDEYGSIIYDFTITCNGSPVSYTAFEAAYEQLITVSVSGLLSESDVWDPIPHTTMTFTDTDGTVHTVSLHDCGLLHDAVSVNGHTVFYIGKGELLRSLQ